MKTFHVSQLISVYTGVLLPTPGTDHTIDGVCALLDYMVGESLQTVALPRAAEEVRPYLLEAHPWLYNTIAAAANIDATNWRTALEIFVKEYGEWHEVQPIRGEDHEHIDPVEEFVRMRPDAKSIIIGLIDIDEPSSYGDIDWKTDDEDES